MGKIGNLTAFNVLGSIRSHSHARTYLTIILTPTLHFRNLHIT
jgi:hypothetical protein